MKWFEFDDKEHEKEVWDWFLRVNPETPVNMAKVKPSIDRNVVVNIDDMLDTMLFIRRLP